MESLWAYQLKDTYCLYLGNQRYMYIRAHLFFGLPNGHGHVSVGKGAGVKGTGSDYFLSIELRNDPQSRFHKCAETELTTAQNRN